MNTMANMDHPSYVRLREIMEKRGIELTDAQLARKLNILDQHITNWKKRGVPKDILIDLADEWHFRIKYVRDGEGNMFESSVLYKNSPESKVLAAMENMDEATKYQMVKISNTFTQPEQSNGTHKQ